MSSAEPQPGRVGASHSGRACPYCRFPLEVGAEAMTCGVCQAIHHGDCWETNHGCAVIACAGGPTHPAPSSGRPPFAGQQAAQSRRRIIELDPAHPSGGPPPWLAVAIIVFVVVLALAGLAIALAVALPCGTPGGPC